MEIDLFQNFVVEPEQGLWAFGMSVNAAPCVSVILTMREMSVILTQIDLLSVKLTHSPCRISGV